MLSSRCTGKGAPKERFLNYFKELDKALASFDTLRLDAVGFACTASSYLVDPEDERRKVVALEAEYGYPVITAASAIHQALQDMGAASVAIACPYPSWLFDRAVSFWKGCGYHIAASVSLQPRMTDTRAIYDVSGAAAGRKLIEEFDGVEADVFVITGTGMPGLQAIVDLQRASGQTVVNSNLCLAWACLKVAGIPFNERAGSKKFPLLGGWKDEIRRL